MAHTMNMVEFISDLSTLSRIVTVGNVKITGKKTGLTMAAVLNTYHYLDEDSTEKNATIIRKRKNRGHADEQAV